MGDLDQSNGPIRIDLEDGLIGEQVGTTDYFFVKIGEAVPLKGDDSNYDLESLPCQPLAVSERFRLMFVAHSSGFFVARTKDVIESAKEFKEKGSGSLVQQLSLVDVSIGRVHILALSTDNSTVAASVANDIQFFSVDNFLNKEVKQTFSCSLNDSAFVKDMRWITSSKDSFVVLSNTGDLYDGKVDSPLKHVMDCVEAVDCGVKGNFIAVARKNVLSILSVKFEEWISISLSFTSWIADSEPSCSVKVDSVKCVRPDSIIIGCFQLTEDGREENYLLQVIGSKHGEITAGCSEFVVQSFYDIYQGLIDDIVPFGNGPYLLLAYLEQCQLAINANKKNTDQHIMLLGWSVNDDKNEAVAVDIERDNSVPRIELQENGDDNLLLGLCVDKVSIYQEVGVQHGVEERTELSPYCVLICLTLEGKLVLFHVASLAGSEVSTEVVSAVLDEGDSSLKQPVKEGSTLSHGFLAGSEVSESEVLTEVVSAVLDEGDSSLKQPVEEGSTLSCGFLAGSEVSESEVSTEVVSAVLDGGDSFLKQPVEQGSTLSHGFQKQELDKASQVSESLKSKPIANSNQMAQTENFNKDPVVSVANLKSLKSNAKQMVPKVDLNQDANSDNKTTSEQQTNVVQKTAGHGSNIGSFMVNSHSAAAALSNYNTSDKTSVMTKVLWNTNSPWDSQRPSHLLPGETFSTPKGFDLSSFSASSSTDGVGYKSQINTMGGTTVHSASVPGRIDGKPSSVQGGNGVPAFNSASMPVQSGGQLTTVQAANMQPASVGSSNLSLHGNTTAGKSSRMFHPSNEQHGTSLKLGTSNSDLSKQFSNINEMTKELDLLLRSIEEAGGFRDACTRLLQSSIEAVEEGMDILSKKCKLWMCQLDEHLEEVHYLLNKTIQAVARKIYMEGIYKQAADSRYWDLWNRQKLNSELELKRQHILSLNQDLTYQLIELERHFNGLELKKFSQYGGRRIDHEAFQSRYGPSRHLQSLHSLHTAISSQLVASENLSERLSKQMAALNLNSLPKEQKNVKELFETIGIPYDTSFGSPDMKGFVKTPSSKKLFSDSATNKDHSRRIQTSAMKNCEPETARRRRDSLDQSWTCFEPPKTTIKRMLLKELPKPNWNGSFSSMNKDKVETSVLKESASQRRDARIPSIVFPASNAKAGTLDSHLEFKEGLEQAFKWADSLQAPTQVSEHKSPVLSKNSISAVPSWSASQLSPAKNSISAVPSWSASQLSPAMMHGSSTETKDMAAEKKNVVQKIDLISNSENMSFLHTKMPQKSPISFFPTTDTPSLLIKSGEMPNTSSKITTAASSTMGNKLSSAFTSESCRKLDIPASESHSSVISKASTSPGKVTGFKISSALPLPSSVSSAPVPPAAVSVAISRSMTTSNTSIDPNNIFSSAAVYSSNQGLKPTVSSLPNTASLNSTSVSLKSEIQPASVSRLKTDLDAAVEVGPRLNEPQNRESELKFGPSGKFTHTNEQSSNNITSSSLNAISVSQSEQPPEAPMQLSTPFPASASVSSWKNGGMDVGISYEDEMEEEAPETSNMAELSLGSHGGFGTSSIPNPSMPKSNPFGDSFGNVATSGSIFTSSVPSGELFRPASFNFPSSQSSATAQSTNSGAFSGGFSAGGAAPAPTPSAFGQPAQIGSGQQVLGSVLGTFGQSRQLGSGLPGSGFAAPSGFGGGFAGSSSNSAFSSAGGGGGFAGIGSAGGGFAGIASTGGGFAGMGSVGGGFAGVTSTSSGFSGLASPVGGFAGTASTGGGFGAVSSTGGFAGAASGGGFGAFSSQGSGGFAAFGSAGGSKPPELFTQIRK